MKRKKKSFCVICVEKEENIKHLAENSFQRNLRVPGGPSDKSPVSTWTFQGLFKANWKVKPLGVSPTCFSLLQVYQEGLTSCLLLNSQLGFCNEAWFPKPKREEKSKPSAKQIWYKRDFPVALNTLWSSICVSLK